MIWFRLRIDKALVNTTTFPVSFSGFDVAKTFTVVNIAFLLREFINSEYDFAKGLLWSIFIINDWLKMGASGLFQLWRRKNGTVCSYRTLEQGIHIHTMLLHTIIPIVDIRYSS